MSEQRIVYVNPRSRAVHRTLECPSVRGRGHFGGLALALESAGERYCSRCLLDIYQRPLEAGATRRRSPSHARPTTIGKADAPASSGSEHRQAQDRPLPADPLGSLADAERAQEPG